MRPKGPSDFVSATFHLLASLVGIISGFVAFILYNLIGFFTNLAFYRVWSFHFRSAAENQLGLWVIVVPVIGGLIIGLMAKYGSPKIRGHGIPEAMEAVLTSKSRIEAKVAILKPISAAIGIGTGGPFGAEGPIIQTGGAFGSLDRPDGFDDGVGAQSSAGLRRGSGTGRDVQCADYRARCWPLNFCYLSFRRDPSFR